MFLEVALVAILAFIVDRILGEPNTYHPLVGFGRFVRFIEDRFKPSTESPASTQFFCGALCYVTAVAVPVVMLMVFYSLLPSSFQTLFTMIVVYFCIAPRSLDEHAYRVYTPLTRGDLDGARKACAMIVSRDTQDLDASQLATATVETVVENAHDAVIAPLFWFLLAGLPGILIFRFSNTLDAMWGYRSERYLFFGRVSARVDDVMGFLSARLTVLLFALYRIKAAKVACSDGRYWYSPNAGPVMAAGAGALNVTLGGDALYQGSMKHRPTLGKGKTAEPEDIPRAIKLVNNSYYMMLLFMLLLGVLV